MQQGKQLMPITIPAGRTLPLKNKSVGIFQSLGVAVAVGGGVGLLARFDFAAGDTLSSPSVNTIGFAFSSTTRSIAPAPNGQNGLLFQYAANEAGESWQEQRYTMGQPQFETYERIVLWIPSNFEHRKLTRLTLATAGSAVSWVKGDVITSNATGSQGLFQFTDGNFVWLKFAQAFFSDTSWVGSITNSARSSTITTTARTFAPGSNNKFSAQWTGAYSGNATVVEYDTGADNLVAENSFFTIKSTAGDGVSSGNGGDFSSGTTGNSPSQIAVPPAIDAVADRGALRDFVIRRKRASALGAADGVMQIWKDGVLVHQLLNASLFSAVANYYDTGYLLGYANSGFDEVTSFYITKYELYGATRPEGV
jgi:hypothetical protein